MTSRELSQLYWLNKEIEQEKKRLAELEAAATDTSVKITGLPHVSGISDKTSIAANIVASKDIIKAKTCQCIEEYNFLNQYISSIDDSWIRNIMVQRHIKMRSWPKIAANMNTTEGSIKMAYFRYLKNH